MGAAERSDALMTTLRAGAGIVSEAAARVLVEEGPERIRELASWGARFDRESGRFHFTREGAHTLIGKIIQNRIVRSGKSIPYATMIPKMAPLAPIVCGCMKAKAQLATAPPMPQMR